MPFARLLLTGALLALITSCASKAPEPAKPLIKAIVGATLIDGTTRPPLVNSVVLVRGPEILQVGPQSTTPVPPGSERTEALGLYVTPTQTGAQLIPGANADLLLVNGNPIDNPLLLSNPVRVLKAGEWTNAPAR
jgi:imidazolonepropionase-like amidohydrolase